jgi:hypothetical protein
LRFRPLEVVDLNIFGAIGGVGVFQAEDFRIVAGLLDSIGRGFAASLRLDDR